MADLEAVLADVSYLMAMEKSKCTPAARASKKIVLPDPRTSSISDFRAPCTRGIWSDPGRDIYLANLSLALHLAFH
ncbi:unnamed protein product [Phaedon cochleariae]|uniref:Uncharacterized protein n=1 Tax=Phaedon cochleariae TaxID=80249 RepID=A0A9N9SAJ5_PHACE|nr:unnamed protein product [Phaedon cochleariae]